MNLEQSSKKYHANHSIVYNCQYHVILCPKYRRKVFYPPLDTRLQELILEKRAAHGYRVLGMAVMPDHVHLLDVNLHIGIAKMARARKIASPCCRSPSKPLYSSISRASNTCTRVIWR